MSAQRTETGKGEPQGNWRRIMDECIAKALGNSFRQQLLWILNERVASPSEIAKELGESLNKVCHHIKVLHDAKCIEQVYERTVGNRVQHFYRATSRAFLEGTDWPDVPETVKGALRATLLQNVINDAVEAVASGTYDAHEGAHMSWTTMILDEQGWVEMAQLLERSLNEVIALQDSTKERLVSNGAMGVSWTVSILGYPSVGGMKKVGPPIGAKELTASPESPKTKARKVATTGSTKATAEGRG